MPGATPLFALPYPLDADPPDGPTQIKTLDERIEKLLARGGQLLQKANAGENAVTTGAGTYQELGTPDKLASKLKIATGGLIFVHYEALWKESALNQGRAAIFVNGVQLKAIAIVSNPNVAVGVGAAIPTGTANKFAYLLSDPIGLIGMKAGSSDATSVATGLASAAVIGTGTGVGERFAYALGMEKINLDDFAHGGICCIRGLPEGEYEIAVRYAIKEAGATTTAKERKLTAWTRDPNP